MTAKPTSSAFGVEVKITNVLKRRHKVAPKMIARLALSMRKAYEQMNGLFGGIAMLIWVVGTGTLIAGVIGVK